MASSSPKQKHFQRTAVSRAVVTACGIGAAALVVMPVQAQQAQLEEIVVTATKRTESVQTVPMAITVLGEQQLQDLNITDMADYIEMLPNVSYVGLGPGSGNVYIRGISSGGESGIGANPSVAIYLDEQPVTSVGSYLNPHIYDVGCRFHRSQLHQLRGFNRAAIRACHHLANRQPERSDSVADVARCLPTFG